MGLIKALDELFGRMFGGDEGGGEPVAIDPALLAAIADEIVGVVEPRMKLVKNWREQLEPGIRATVAHMQRYVREFPPPVELSRDAWSRDPSVRAFFAAADDVERVIGSSEELREFFDAPAHAAVDEACVVLGMRCVQKKVLASTTIDGQLRQDVERTTVSFEGQRLLAPTESEQALRIEVGRRLLRTLAQVALGRISGTLEQAKDLDQRKAYLRVRLKYLHAGARSAEGMVSDAAHLQEIAELESQLNDTVRDLAKSKRKLVTMNDYLDQVRQVLEHPQQHLQLQRRTLRLTPMNFVAVEGDGEEAHEVAYVDLAIGELVGGSVVAARCARGAMPKEVSMWDRAATELL